MRLSQDKLPPDREALLNRLRSELSCYSNDFLDQVYSDLIDPTGPWNRHRLAPAPALRLVGDVKGGE